MAGALSIAIDRRRWDVAALCLVMGYIEAMRRVPAESVTEMLDLLGGEMDETLRKEQDLPRESTE